MKLPIFFQANLKFDQIRDSIRGTTFEKLVSESYFAVDTSEPRLFQRDDKSQDTVNQIVHFFQNQFIQNRNSKKQTFLMTPCWLCHQVLIHFCTLVALKRLILKAFTTVVTFKGLRPKLHLQPSLNGLFDLSYKMFLFQFVISSHNEWG